MHSHWPREFVRQEEGNIKKQKRLALHATPSFQEAKKKKKHERRGTRSHR